MKKDIHPKYNEKLTVTCACGNSFETGSTSDSLVVEICSACHPFWTGDQKFVDIEGRVDKFKKKQEVADKARAARIKAIKAKASKAPISDSQDGPRTLKDMLKNLQ